MAGSRGSLMVGHLDAQLVELMVDFEVDYLVVATVAQRAA